MEGVLVPEIWIAVAEATNIPELRLTTREVSDYDVLMKGRIAILDKHGIKLSDIQKVIAQMGPIPGAKAFVDELRTFTQVIILSDTFEQFAKPLIQQLNWPTLFCHTLEVVNDKIVGYKLRLTNQKQKSVAAIKLLNFQVIAAGDAFNDTAMLGEADLGFLFKSPEAIQKQFPQFTALEEYDDLMARIRQAVMQS